MNIKTIDRMVIALVAVIIVVIVLGATGVLATNCTNPYDCPTPTTEETWPESTTSSTPTTTSSTSTAPSTDASTTTSVPAPTTPATDPTSTSSPTPSTTLSSVAPPPTVPMKPKPSTTTTTVPFVDLVGTDPCLPGPIPGVGSGAKYLLPCTLPTTTVAASQVLPVTGSDSFWTAAGALAFLVLGLAALAMARRPK